MTRTIVTLALLTTVFTTSLEAQTLFGSSCAGASGVTPTLSVVGPVKSGQTYSVEVAAPGGIGFGYLLIGFSNTSASAFGGLPLPLDLGGFFADPLWTDCTLNVDPSYTLAPFLFDPNTNGGVTAFTFPGFDFGTVYMQSVNIDPDFTTRIAGVSQGLAIRRTAPAGMVAIEPATFTMGSNAFAVQFPNEGPVRQVTLSKPFWIGTHEVTQAEYQAVMGTNPSFFVGPNLPVDTLSWFDAVAYCTALTAQQALLGNVPAGYEFRLPTEAEWEYCCRAGTTTEWNTGGSLNTSQANFQGALADAANPFGKSAPVGSYAPNAFGLYDMHGNLQEWCLDSYSPFYAPGPITDPFVTGTNDRIIRGGSYFALWSATNCRSAFRYAFPAQFTNGGVRVVLAPILVP
jgi:formylglycine-generating enzyme required for sulfatase activity